MALITNRTATTAFLAFAVLCVFFSGSITRSLLKTEVTARVPVPQEPQQQQPEQPDHKQPDTVDTDVHFQGTKPHHDTASPIQTVVVVDTEAPTTLPPPPTTTETPPAPTEPSFSDDLVKHVYDILRRGKTDPKPIPVWCVPLFHDRDELESQLRQIDYPVRRFEFVQNGNDPDVSALLTRLKVLEPYGVAIHHAPENIGFSGAMNKMITHSNSTLDPLPEWWFLVNADAVFNHGVLDCFAQKVWAVHLTHGMLYGPRQDHFAFAITQKSVNTVGLWDEVFFPGYMEDIDYHWRTCMAGLPQLITGCPFVHKGSVNMHKPRASNDGYHQQLVRNSHGWEYGRQKWGYYKTWHIEDCKPPSGWKTPFNIPNAPLSLWKIDPGHRSCVVSGHGTYYESSSTCWYNLRVLEGMVPKSDLDKAPGHLFTRRSQGPI